MTNAEQKRFIKLLADYDRVVSDENTNESYLDYLMEVGEYARKIFRKEIDKFNKNSL